MGESFDFLGWNFRVQSNGKFRSTPSVGNFKAFREKVKAIVNNSKYGAKVKAEKLAPIVRNIVLELRTKCCYLKTSENIDVENHILRDGDPYFGSHSNKYFDKISTLETTFF
jgi:retron-type reverse transcriptase